jgi:hypothetical protein
MNILEIRNLLRKALVMKGFLIIVNQSFSKVFEMRKSLLLESDEKEKCINVKPSYTLRSEKNEKGFMRLRHVCGGDYFGPRDIHRSLSSVPLLDIEMHLLKDVENAVIHL